VTVTSIRVLEAWLGGIIKGPQGMQVVNLVTCFEFVRVTGLHHLKDKQQQVQTMFEA
jgi:hypothetical protein